MSTLAERQLAAWQAIARTWDARDCQQTVRVCNGCKLGMYLVTDQTGIPYQYTDDELLTMVVLHLRNHHMELDPEWPD